MMYRLAGIVALMTVAACGSEPRAAGGTRSYRQPVDRRVRAMRLWRHDRDGNGKT